jgi:Urease accessory protein UreE
MELISLYVTEVAAKRGQYQADFLNMDYLRLSWEDLRKRRLRATTEQGREIEMALSEGGSLSDGDLLAVEDKTGIVIQTIPELVLVIQPSSVESFGLISYELGNRHLPAWISVKEILVLMDPLLKVYLKQQMIPFTEQLRVLTDPELVAVGGGIGHHHHHSGK